MKNKITLEVRKETYEYQGDITRYLTFDLTVEGVGAEETADKITAIMKREFNNGAYDFDFAYCPDRTTDENGEVISYIDGLAIPFEYGYMTKYKAVVKDAYKVALKEIAAAAKEEVKEETREEVKEIVKVIEVRREENRREYILSNGCTVIKNGVTIQAINAEGDYIGSKHDWTKPELAKVCFAATQQHVDIVSTIEELQELKEDILNAPSHTALFDAIQIIKECGNYTGAYLHHITRTYYSIKNYAESIEYINNVINRNARFVKTVLKEIDKTIALHSEVMNIHNASLTVPEVEEVQEVATAAEQKEVKQYREMLTLSSGTVVTLMKQANIIHDTYTYDIVEQFVNDWYDYANENKHHGLDWQDSYKLFADSLQAAAGEEQTEKFYTLYAGIENLKGTELKPGQQIRLELFNMSIAEVPELAGVTYKEFTEGHTTEKSQRLYIEIIAAGNNAPITIHTEKENVCLTTDEEKTFINYSLSAADKKHDNILEEILMHMVQELRRKKIHFALWRKETETGIKGSGASRVYENYDQVETNILVAFNNALAAAEKMN